MTGIIQRCESLDALAPACVQLVAKVTQDVLIDRTNDGLLGVAYRWIQNLTGGDVYYAIGCTAMGDAGQYTYHGKLSDGQQLSVPTKRRVSCWSNTGGTIAVLELVKKDL